MNTSVTLKSDVGLSACQIKAKAEIESWLVDPDSPEFILSGGAGVGKSYLIDLVLNDLKTINEMRELLGVKARLHDVHFTATTNKAASVIQGQTIFSLIGVSIFNDYKTGETKYGYGGAKNIHDSLIIVDEASMISDEVLSMIRNYCVDCKILFVGDKYQLNPVGLDYSPVFDSGIPMVEMTTQRRQDEDSYLYEVIQSVRDWVDTGVAPSIIGGTNVSYVTDIELKRFAADNNPDDKIISFTNKSCLELIKFVRYINQLPTDFFQEDERVISNSTIVSQKKYNSIYTDAEYTISNIGKVEDYHGMFEYRYCMLDHIDAIVPVDSVKFQNTLKSLKKAKDWKTYFHLKETFADVRDAYAITAHKAQGSTYDRVLINLNNFKKCPDKDMLARLLYVALSRAKHEVLLYGSL